MLPLTVTLVCDYLYPLWLAFHVSTWRDSIHVVLYKVGVLYDLGRLDGYDIFHLFVTVAACCWGFCCPLWWNNKWFETQHFYRVITTYFPNSANTGYLFVPLFLKVQNTENKTCTKCWWNVGRHCHDPRLPTLWLVSSCVTLHGQRFVIDTPWRRRRRHIKWWYQLSWFVM